jgi:aminoglycoside phosphotransferase (APT) family kinase protein
VGIEVEFAEDNFVRSTKRANHARVVARSLAPQLQALFPDLFPKAPRVEAIADQGWCNLVLFVGSGEGAAEYVLRLAARSALADMQSSRSMPHLEKERYILDQLRSFDFVPRVVGHATGTCVVQIPGHGVVEYGYLLQTALPFKSARAVKADLDRNRYLWQLGEIMRAIQIPLVKGFGAEFDPLQNGFAAQSFAESLTTSMQTIEEAPIAPSMKRWLGARLEGLVALAPEPRLYHKDLLGNLGNFLVDGKGNVRGVIDWEFAGSGLALHAELASFLYVLVRDGHSQESIQADRNAVLGGYGITEQQYREHYERDVETLVLLHSISALIKCDVLTRNGTLTQEPWRKVFAERADALCVATFRKDAPRIGRGG